MENSAKVHDIALPVYISIVRTDEYRDPRCTHGSFEMFAVLSNVAGKYMASATSQYSDPLYATRYTFPGSGLDITLVQRHITPVGVSTQLIAGATNMSVDDINASLTGGKSSAETVYVRNYGKIAMSARQDDAEFTITFKKVNKNGEYCISDVSVSLDAQSLNYHLECVKLMLDNLTSRDLADTLRRAGFD